MSEGTIPDIDEYSVKGFSLRFVDGDRPSKLHRKLGECPDDRWSDHARDRIGEKMIHFPCMRIHIDRLSSLTLDLEIRIPSSILAKCEYFPDRSIDPPSTWIIRNEHDLRTDFEGEFSFCRELSGIHSSCHKSRKNLLASSKLDKTIMIHTFCSRIGSRERDHHTTRWIRQFTPTIEELEIRFFW